jgi:hypothetical protein
MVRPLVGVMGLTFLPAPLSWRANSGRYEAGVGFILRQKKRTYSQLSEQEQYHALQDLNIQPGTEHFFQGIHHTKSYKLGSFNLAIRWKRRYRGEQAKDPWYLLTNLDSLQKTLKFYAARFGIEMCQPQYTHRRLHPYAAFA